MGVAPIVSYQYGQRNYKGLKKVFKICISFIAVVSVIIFVLSMAFGTPLAGIFSMPGTQVYDIARKGFLIFPFSFLFCGINIFASAFFTALSNGRVSALISVLRSFVWILFFLFTLPLLWKETGVWLAVPLSELVTMFISSVFLWKHWKGNTG
jgi:Na+-driven multidrug efflux pump